MFANVFGYATEDYVEVVRVLEDAPGLAGYELNVSCPNTRHGGIYFSNDPALLAEVTGAVKRVAKRPLIVKLSPNVAHIAPLAQAAAEAGARCHFAGEHFHRAGGGCAHAAAAHWRRASAGSPVRPSSRSRCAWFIRRRKAVKIPVVGIGGIATGEDAAEFMIAGATAVEVGTATFWDPASPARIARELGDFLKEQKIAQVSELVGTLQRDVP